MSVLLDTNICIACLNRSSILVQESLERLRPEEVFVSAISIAELRFGAQKSQRQKENHRVLDIFTDTINVIEFDELSATTYGAIRMTLEAAGTPIGPLDTLIAAQALAHNLILVTNNTREFQRVPGLKIENWL